MLSIRTVVVFLVLAGAAWAAGTPAQKGAGASRPAATISSTRAGKSDAEIEKTIQAKFAKSKIAPEKFTVHVQGGVATIEGKTDVIQHKGVATRLAKSGGALAVNNHIQISDAAREKAAGNLESGRRRAQVKRGDARSEGRTEVSAKK